MERIIEEIINEAEKDLEINYEGNIGEQVARQPMIVSKWLRKLKTEAANLKMLYIKRDKLKSDLWLYYTGRAPKSVYQEKPLRHKYLKSEVSDAINQDREYTKLNATIMIKEEVVGTLEEIYKAVKDKQWQLKNIIEWRKFEAGE